MSVAFSPWPASGASAAAVVVLIAASSSVLLVDAQSQFKSADRGFLCERLWTGPSKDNSLVACLQNQNHMTNVYLMNGARVVPFLLALIGLILGVFCFLFYPFIACCCGGSDDTPDAVRAEKYTRGQVRCTKIFAFIVCIAGFAALLLTLIGASTTVDAFGKVFDNGLSIISWGEAAKNNIKTEMTTTDDNGNAAYIPPLTEALFTDMQSKLDGYRKQISDLKTQYGALIGNANIGAIILALFPIIMCGGTLFCAIVNKKGLFLTINTILHWFSIFVYGVLGAVFVVTSVLLTDVVAEREKFLALQPGMFLWSLVPQFDAEAPFKGMIDSVQQAERDSSLAACQALEGICSSTQTAFSAATPKIIFSCPTFTTSSACTSNSIVTGILNRTKIFSDSPTFCSNTTAADRDTCTVAMCAVNCQEGDSKESCKTLTKKLDQATRSFRAFDIALRPLLSFQTIFTKLMELTTALPFVSDGLSESGAGLLSFCFVFVVGMVVIWRGRKMFFSHDAVNAAGGVDDGKPTATGDTPAHTSQA